LLASLALFLFLVGSGLTGDAGGPAGENTGTVSLTILGTTDVHGNVWPYDYLRGQPAERGLAKVATYVKQVRAEQENVLLVDSGDTFQGTPLAYYAATKYSDKPNPTVAAMNAMGYDAMAVGNHEFNFGLRALWRMKEQAKFPLLGANIVSTYHDGRRDFEPYVIREVEGVRIALLGLITPAVPNWDPPEHLTGYTFRDPVEVAKEIVPELRKKADVVVVLIHSGLGASIETGEPDAEGTAENRTYELVKQVAGIDVVFLGHSHRVVGGEFINNAVLIQPKNWAQQVARADLTLTREGNGWKITDKRPALVGLSERYSKAAEDASALPPDEEILDLTREAHERTERELNTVVARLDRDLDGRTGHIEDHPLVDIIHRAQLEATGADVSLAALFGTFTHWKVGPVTMRDVYSLYFYENKLVAVGITGQQLKDALEHAVERFNSWPWDGGGPFNGPLYNLDFAQGVSYEIDLSRPVGERIVNLRRDGSPLDLGAKLTLALNSYRWSGGGDFEMLRHAKVVKRVDRQVRELIAEMLLREKTTNATTDDNWRIVPDEAAKAVREFVTQPRRR
jgi:2',3'-cyclic-nucleotide 2'-phosphodiesterase/3'-nucleotidase